MISSVLWFDIFFITIMQLQKQNIKTQQKERERSEKKTGTKQNICPECGATLSHR